MNDGADHVLPPFDEVTIAMRASQLALAGQANVLGSTAVLRCAHPTWTRLVPFESVDTAIVGKPSVRNCFPGLYGLALAPVMN